MSLIEPTNYAPTMSTNVVNGEQQIYNKIKAGSGKEQLKKVAKEFESIFISKMFSEMDKTVDKEGGIFGDETKYFDNLKSYMYNEMGRNLANNPHSTFGFAKQIYEQMEKNIPQ